MAEIVISIDELVHILNANNILPPRIREIEKHHQGISFKFRTALFPLMLIRVILKFSGFENDCAIFEVVQNPLMKKFDWLIHKIIESMEMPDYISKIEYPAVHINTKDILAQQLKGVQINHIRYKDGLFYVILARI